MPTVDPMKWRAIQRKYAAFTVVEERADHDRGVDDGVRCRSDWDRTMRAGEERILAEMNVDTLAYRDSCLAELRTENRELTTLTTREVELLDRKHRQLAGYNHRLAELDIDSSSSSERYDELRKAHEDALSIHDELRAELGRSPAATIPGRYYWPLIFAVFMAEIPLNATALELLGDLQRYYNWIFAFIAGLGFVGSAHLLGVNVRQIFGAIDWAGVAKRTAAILFFIAVMLGALSVLAHLRDQVLQLQGQAIGKLGTSASQVLGKSIEIALAKGPLGITAEALQLAMLNAFVVALAAVLAFFHVDPDDRYEVATFRLGRAARAFERHRRRNEGKLKQLMEQQRLTDTKLDTLIGEVRRRQTQLSERLDGLRQAATNGAAVIAGVRERRLAAYRQGFLRGCGRVGGATLAGPDPKQPDPDGAATEPEAAAQTSSDDPAASHESTGAR